VDAVVLSGDGMKQEQFYVAASRGREGITVITSDIDRLRESLGISSARPSATELTREQTRQSELANGVALVPEPQIDPLKIGREIGYGHDLGIGF
jgi:hypothetical protein